MKLRWRRPPQPPQPRWAPPLRLSSNCHPSFRVRRITTWRWPKSNFQDLALGVVRSAGGAATGGGVLCVVVGCCPLLCAVAWHCVRMDSPEFCCARSARRAAASRSRSLLKTERHSSRSISRSLLAADNIGGFGRKRKKKDVLIFF